MESQDGFKSLQKSVQESLVSTVKYVNRIAAEDLTFQRTVNPHVADQLDQDSARLLGLSTRLLESAASACGLNAPVLEDADDVDLRWQSVLDVVDSLLEKADTALDEFTGLVKRKEPSTQEPKPRSTAGVVRHVNIIKPQTRFEVQPDNYPKGPWKPILTQKPHATVSLKKSLVTIKAENNTIQYQHPYFTEISNMKYPPAIYEKAEPIPPQPMEKSSAIWVDTYQGVVDMLQDLKKAKEIAVDLEHHDFRTYTGLVCLMQISTREKDWIVDTLQPWRHKLEILNQVFADPSIIKVFHGAYMDMVWLQRDLGLYVNGLFDTFFASDLLAYPSKSLAFLLAKFVNFNADKKYQLADWRVRPIPSEMLFYARSDTHFLLYIYDNLRNDLISQTSSTTTGVSYIERALERSRDLSLSRHEHPDYDAQTGYGTRGWYNYLLKNAHMNFDGEQFAMFRALWDWRDETGRRQDENPNFVLAPINLINIIKVNPPDIKALHSLLTPTAMFARDKLNKIWSLLQEARAKGGPSVLHFLTSQSSASSVAKSAPPAPKAADEVRASNGDVAVPTMTRSQLFGDMPPSTVWERSKDATSDAEEDTVPFPWERFVQETTGGEAAEPEEAEAEASVAAPAPEAQPAATEADDDAEFTLKRSRKRARAEEASSDDAASDGVIAIEDEAKTSTRKKRSKKKKKNKKNKKHDDAEAEFDYSQAPSMLHGRAGAETSRKKAFDPYGVAADDGALKGARKAPPVRGERSATFKK